MTSDEELNKLADEYMESQIDQWESLADFESFKAGFRAAKKMMAERLPTDVEMSREYGRYGMIREWLKQKLFNKGEEK